ncbi:MAG: hypothetical protein JWL83_3965 [Actinomycetia bacterium]|nr:hypothetical protein [Actinomycetes bacterium]
MSAFLALTQVEFTVSGFVPLALGFFGLGTGYLVYGPEELFKLPGRSRAVDLTTGLWGIWMPGFLQFLTGVYLWVGLLWLHTVREPALYMAALAFTAYGVHWWALGMTRVFGGDPRPNGFMAVAFTMLSALGIVVFFKAGDAPVGGLFIGLTAVYICEFIASLGVRESVGADGRGAQRTPTRLGETGERALGFFHIGTGLWLMYLTWAVTLGITVNVKLPV